MKKNSTPLTICNTLLITACFMLLVFSGSWHYGIEITRYILIPLCLAFLYFFPEQRKKFLTSKELWLLTAFLGTACIGLLVEHQSLRGIDRILNWILALGAGFTAAALLGDKKSWLLTALPLGLIGYTLGAILLHTFGYTDIDILKTSRLILFYADGTQSNRLIILCGTGVLSLYFIAIESKKKKFMRVFCIFGAVILFILSFITNARTGFFALIIAFMIMSIIIFKKSIKKIILAGAILALITICIAQFSTQQPSSRRYANIITNIKTDISFRQRFFIWDAAWDIFSKKPFLGHGFTTFHKAYQNEYSAAKKDLNFKKKYPYINPSTNNAHNFILHFLAETGSIGCLIMLSFWGTLVWKGFRSSSMLGVTIASVFILAFLEFQLNMNLYDRHVSTVLFAYAGILASQENT